MKIKFFWVWASLQPTLNNTHFLIEDWDNKLQVDCGWGLKLAQLVKKWEIKFNNIFISHCHTDHFLWFFNLLRTIPKKIDKLNVYCSKKLEKNVRIIAWLIMKKAINERFDNWIINFYNIDNLEKNKILDFELFSINLNSKKMEQYWFFLKLNRKSILFFWDESVWILDRTDLYEYIWVDYLICEALVPDSESLSWWWTVDLVKMSHISARHAWKIAKKFKVKNLILIHTREFKNRQELLRKDASLEYDWNIIVPNDNDEINI